MQCGTSCSTTSESHRPNLRGMKVSHALEAIAASGGTAQEGQTPQS